MPPTYTHGIHAKPPKQEQRETGDVSNEASCGVCTDFKVLRRSGGPKQAQNASSNHKNGSSNHTNAFANAFTNVQCPPDKSELGQHTWTFLHTTADNPSQNDKTQITNLITAVSALYPCTYCASHLRDYIDRNPVDVSNSKSLSLWMCNLHNEINVGMGKQPFDCAKVNERWRVGRDECFGDPDT